MTPSEAARAIEDELYAVSGKPVLVQKDSAVAAYASIRIASDDSPAHLLRFRPEFESDLPYLSAFQCGLALRIAAAHPACRFDLTSTATMRENVQQLVEETLKKNRAEYPTQMVIQLSNQLGQGLGLQLRSIPVAIRVDDWINREYPALRTLQRKSNERQLQEAMQSLGPSVRAFAPQPIIDANLSMSCAFAKFWASTWNEPEIAVPFIAAGYGKVGDDLLRLVHSSDPGPEADRELVTHWVERLNLTCWFKTIDKQ
ncbi:MAG: hypothetical protein ACKO3T_23500 [Planctomycetaceae bacterium]